MGTETPWTSINRGILATTYSLCSLFPTQDHLVLVLNLNQNQKNSQKKYVKAFLMTGKAALKGQLECRRQELNRSRQKNH